jgi:hypothetical protein
VVEKDGEDEEGNNEGTVMAEDEEGNNEGPGDGGEVGSEVCPGAAHTNRHTLLAANAGT